MHDTPFDMDEKQRAIIRSKTPLERIKMGCSMYETSRYLIQRSILENNPEISKKALLKELFLKFYKNDFTSAECERIIKYLQK